MQICILTIFYISSYTVVGAVYWACTKDFSEMERSQQKWFILGKRSDKFIYSRIGESVLNIKDFVIFQLFTRKNPINYMILTPFQDNFGNLDMEKSIRIVIHSWLSNAKEMIQIKDDYLSVADINVILVDWGKHAEAINYVAAKQSVPDVGQILADNLIFLVSKGLNLSNVHIVGHGLGAHIAGVAGHRLYGELARITGLDPAKQNYEGEPLENCLDKTDAQFVQVIHTSPFGIDEPIGHVDFYPNKGSKNQPGCGPTEVIGSECSHIRALNLFSSSIVSRTNFYAYKCDSVKNYNAGKCFNNAVAVMGEYTNSSATGNYYLNTSRICPYTTFNEK